MSKGTNKTNNSYLSKVLINSNTNLNEYPIVWNEQTIPIISTLSVDQILILSNYALVDNVYRKPIPML